MCIRKFSSTTLRHLIVITLYIVCFINASGGFGFDYSSGATDWVNGCNGQHQSPIKIVTSTVKKGFYQQIRFDGKPRRLNLVRISNNGHAVQVTAGTDLNKPLITGGPMQNKIFKFEQSHFHWSENDHVNSEHQIDNIISPLEMHLVFYNTKYDNFTEARDKSDGLTVLTRLFKISKRDNSAFEFTERFNEIVEFGASFSYDFTKKQYSPLLPKFGHSYFTYQGSLTTPPCSETVTFIVFTAFVPISSNQLKKFRLLRSEDGDLILKNSRPAQPLNNRNIYVYEHGKTLHKNNVVKDLDANNLFGYFSELILS